MMDLKDKHKGEDCLLLGAGPSLADFSKDQIKEIAKDKIVFAIKQALNQYPRADYHLYNGNNLQYYPYNVHKPFVIIGLASNNRMAYLETMANYFIIIEQNCDYSNSLSATHDFENNTIEKRPYVRKFGPGILWSIAIPMIQFLGFKNIYSIGVDLAPKGCNTRTHFYKNTVINKAHDLNKNEANNEIELSKVAYNWLQTYYINWYILNKNSYLHSSIPRLNEKTNI